MSEYVYRIVLASGQSRALHVLDARGAISAALECCRERTPTDEELAYAEAALRRGLKALDLARSPRAGENGVAPLALLKEIG